MTLAPHGELAPSYQVLYVNVQFSHGLVLGLFDVGQIFIPGLPVTGALIKTVGKSLEYSACIIQLVVVHLVLQGCPSLRCLLASIEQDMYDLCCLGGASNHEVLLQPLLVEGPSSLLVLSIPVHPGDHVCWYVYCHSG